MSDNIFKADYYDKSYLFNDELSELINDFSRYKAYEHPSSNSKMILLSSIPKTFYLFNNLSNL